MQACSWFVLRGCSSLRSLLGQLRLPLSIMKVVCDVDQCTYAGVDDRAQHNQRWDSRPGAHGYKASLHCGRALTEALGKCSAHTASSETVRASHYRCVLMSSFLQHVNCMCHTFKAGHCHTRTSCSLFKDGPAMVPSVAHMQELTLICFFNDMGKARAGLGRIQHHQERWYLPAARMQLSRQLRPCAMCCGTSTALLCCCRMVKSPSRYGADPQSLCLTSH